jgi:hypothetical protein
MANQVIYHQKLWEILHTAFSIGDMDVAQLRGGWGMSNIATVFFLPARIITNIKCEEIWYWRHENFKS